MNLKSYRAFFCLICIFTLVLFITGCEKSPKEVYAESSDFESFPDYYNSFQEDLSSKDDNDSSTTHAPDFTESDVDSESDISDGSSVSENSSDEESSEESKEEESKEDDTKEEPKEEEPKEDPKEEEPTEEEPKDDPTEEEPKEEPKEEEPKDSDVDLGYMGPLIPLY